MAYARGLTPNPCLVCNRVIKWVSCSSMPRRSVQTISPLTLCPQALGGGWTEELLRAVDQAKDQSYVLHVLTQERLGRPFFRWGVFQARNPRVRPELQPAHCDSCGSQDLCFLAGQDYRDFIRRNASQIALPGSILNRLGQALGEHHGLAYYTIGQRKGLGIPSSVPLYVLSKDATTNSWWLASKRNLGRVS